MIAQNRYGDPHTPIKTQQSIWPLMVSQSIFTVGSYSLNYYETNLHFVP